MNGQENRVLDAAFLEEKNDLRCNDVPDWVKGCIEDTFGRLVRDREESGPTGRDREGIRHEIRAPYKLKSKRVFRDSMPEMDSLELADKVRSDNWCLKKSGIGCPGRVSWFDEVSPKQGASLICVIIEERGRTIKEQGIKAF